MEPDILSIMDFPTELPTPPQVSEQTKMEVLSFKPLYAGTLKDGKRAFKDQTGMALLFSPPKELIDQLEKDPRIEYVNFEKLPNEVLIQLQREKSEVHLAAIYRRGLEDFLAVKIRDEFKDQLPVGVRGTAASINGGVYSNGLLIRDVRQILDMGQEQGKTTTKMREFPEPGSNGEFYYEISNYPIKYTGKASHNLSGGLEAEGEADKVFPVLLVYDLSKVERTDDLFVINLPESQEDRKGVLLKAYILDFPTFDISPPFTKTTVSQ